MEAWSSGDVHLHLWEGQMEHAGVSREKQIMERKILKLWKDCAQVLLQSIPHPASKPNTSKPPKDTQWERKRNTCTAYRYGLKATGSRRPSGLVWAGACSGSTLQNTWSLLDLITPEGWPGYSHLRDRGHSSHLEKHAEGRGGRAGSTCQAHRKSADHTCRAAGTQLDPSIGTERLPHSNHSCIFPANTAWMCRDFSDRGLETTASTSHGNETFRPF